LECNQEAVVIVRIVIAYVLLMSSLLAQTQGATPAVPAKTQAATADSSVAPAKIDAAKEADIRRLLDLAKFALLANQMMEGMDKNLRPLLAGSFPPGEYRDKLIDLFFAKFHSKVVGQQVLDLAVPIYDRYYSDEEIKSLIRFYETPVGQKMASVMPQMSVELQEAGSKWGESIGRDSMMEVLAEHPELVTALQNASKKKTTNIPIE
jgi:uncharacterized protein